MTKLRARVNPETRRLDLSDGRSLPIPSQFKEELFPETPEEELLGEEKSKLRGQANSAFMEGLFKAGEGSSIGRGTKDVGNYLSSVGEAFATRKGQEEVPFWERQSQNYQAKRKANETLSQEISEESPTASLVGTGVGIGADLLALRKLPGVQALPVMEAAGKGTDLIRNPLESIKDIGIAAAEGFVGDKIIGGLTKAAGRRGAMRANAAETEAVAQQNAAGKARNIFEQEEAMLANKEAQSAYKNQILDRNQTIQQMKSDRAMAIHERDQQLAGIKKQIQEKKLNEQEGNRLYNETRNAWENDIKAIDNEYNAAVNEHKQSLKNVPDMQRKANEEYSKEVVKNAKKITRVMGKEDRILSNQVNVDNFFENVVNTSEHAGTKEAGNAKKFIDSLFPKDKVLSSGDIVKRYESLEKRILSSSPEEASILLDFKNHLGTELPSIIESSMAYRSVMPSMKKDLKTVVRQFVKENGIKSNKIPMMEHNLNAVIKEISPENFAQKFADGSLKKELFEKMSNDKFFGLVDYKDSISELRNRPIPFGQNRAPIEQEIKMLQAASDKQAKELTRYIEDFSKRLEPLFEKYSVDFDIAKNQMQKRLGRAFEKTLGKADDVVPPSPPVREGLPPEPVRPVPQDYSIPDVPAPIPPLREPPLPNAPAQVAVPPDFIPQNAPELAPASGLSEKLGQSLENFKFGNLAKGTGIGDNPITKLAALKYVMGKAALPVEAAVGGGIATLKGLTAPTSVGQFIRNSVLREGFRGVYAGFDQFARSNYQTYKNGVIQSPEERFQAVSTIENDPFLKIEEKAMLQKKINRGEPLTTR